MLPEGLPSSIYYKKKTPEKPKAKIKYWVKAVVHGVSTGGIVGFFTDRDLKYKQVIAIREKPVAFKANEQQQETSKIKTWCCIDQGVSSMWAAFEKNIYTPQEVAKAVIHVDNEKCRLPVKHIKFFIQ